MHPQKEEKSLCFTPPSGSWCCPAPLLSAFSLLQKSGPLATRAIRSKWWNSECHVCGYASLCTFLLHSTKLGHLHAGLTVIESQITHPLILPPLHFTLFLFLLLSSSKFSLETIHCLELFWEVPTSCRKNTEIKTTFQSMQMGSVAASVVIKQNPHLHIKPHFKNYFKWEHNSSTKEFLTEPLKLALGRTQEQEMTWNSCLSVLILEEMRCISMITLPPLHNNNAKQWAGEKVEL